MTETQRAALTVEANPEQAMDYQLHLSLMEQKFRKLIQADPKEAQAAMEMSAEGAPELWTIAATEPMKAWPAQLANSEVILNLLRLIDWNLENQPGARPTPPEPISLREILEEML
jgi:hypothetical protein